MKIRVFVILILLQFSTAVIINIHQGQSYLNLKSSESNSPQYSAKRMTSSGPSDSFTFVVAADMRNFSGPGQYDNSSYFRGAMESISALGDVQFMVSPGDIDPTIDVSWTISDTMGEAFKWYPIVGNHELPGAGYEGNPGDNMDWLRNFDYGVVNPGPAGCTSTTYSFDYSNVHFVMLNEYCDNDGDDVTSGDIPDHLFNWLQNDLDADGQEFTFVFGHEPAFPMPDADNGRLRHTDDSLNQFGSNRDRFWNLLKSKNVVVYICGHTHNYSATNFNNVWQIDVGHARGLGDTGAPSTFVVIHVTTNSVIFETYRDDSNGGPYSRSHYGVLAPADIQFLPLIMH